MLPPRAIEIVEPTLASEAGHCAALFASLHAAAPALPVRLWIDRHAQVPRLQEQGVPLQRFFRRRWRKLQALWLYRRLLRSGAPILVPTATWFDLRALDLAARGPIPPRRAFLYFHKWRASARRAQALARLARRQPDLALFGTSQSTWWSTWPQPDRACRSWCRPPAIITAALTRARVPICGGCSAAIAPT